MQSIGFAQLHILSTYDMPFLSLYHWHQVPSIYTLTNVLKQLPKCLGRSLLLFFLLLWKFHSFSLNSISFNYYLSFCLRRGKLVKRQFKKKKKKAIDDNFSQYLSFVESLGNLLERYDRDSQKNSPWPILRGGGTFTFLTQRVIDLLRSAVNRISNVVVPEKGVVSTSRFVAMIFWIHATYEITRLMNTWRRYRKTPFLNI